MKKKFNLEDHKKYIAFLEKRLNSKNYKANVSIEDFDKTKGKLKKAKLILKFYKQKL